MPKLFGKKKILTMTCARCMKVQDKLAWFVSKNSMYNESALCRICFKQQFNQLSEAEKGQWAFYDNNNPNEDKDT